jgi:hypothetical protein
MQIWKKTDHYGEIWSFLKYVHAVLFSNVALEIPEDSVK